MDPVKKVKYDNAEMANFLQQFPIEEPKDVGQSLVRLENDVTAIRSQLECKVKKVTLAQLEFKLDTIIKILLQNGLTFKADESIWKLHVAFSAKIQLWSHGYI